MAGRNSWLATCAVALTVVCAQTALAQTQIIGTSVKNYGATGKGIVDDSTAIQTAINSNASVYFPSGRYLITKTINLKRGQTLFGADYSSTVITYNGIGDALRFSSGRINSSNGGQVNLQDLQIVGTNAANTGAGVDIVAGGFSFFDLVRIRVTGTFKYGVIFDQAEIARLRESIVDNGGTIADSANVWITNGDEHTAGMAIGFTNVIQVRDNQFNSARVGVMDDGGNNHTIESNNFNGHSIPLRVAGTGSIQIRGNTFETQRTDGEANVLFTTTAGVAGGSVANKGPSVGGVIEGNTFAGGVGPAAQSMLKFAAADVSQFHSAFTVTANHFELHYGRGAAIEVTQLRNSFNGFNQDDAGVQYNHYAGVHTGAFANTLLQPARDSDDPNRFVPGGSAGPDTTGTTVGGAVMIKPAPGARLSSPSITLEWSAAIGAQNYWLDVGSTPGGTDLYSANQRMATTAAVTVPMDGRTTYVKLRTLMTDRWAARDYVYTAPLPPAAAEMLSPAAGTTLPKSSANFTWTSGNGVSQIWLDVGTTLGAAEVYGASQNLGTSATISQLPGDGTPVYARLWSLTGSGWLFTDYTYASTAFTTVPAGLLSPLTGSSISPPSATFAWTPGDGVQQIWLDVGTTPGGSEIYASSQGLARSHTVTGLPSGATIHVRLWSLVSGGWRYTDYSFRTA